MAIITPTTCTVLRPRLAKRVGTFRWSKRWSLRDLRTRIPDAGKIRRASPPSSSLERDFCRRRLARQKGPEGDVSAQRPEIGDHLASDQRPHLRGRELVADRKSR